MLEFVYQFSKIGVELTEEQIDLYRHMAHGDFKASVETLEKTKKLYVELIKANADSQYVPHEAFKKYLAGIWFHHCLNVKDLKCRFHFFRSACFYKNYPMSVTDKLKLLLKK